nr:ABC transporter-like protein [Aureimonas sp. AU4]
MELTPPGITSWAFANRLALMTVSRCIFRATFIAYLRQGPGKSRPIAIGRYGADGLPERFATLVPDRGKACLDEA